MEISLIYINFYILKFILNNISSIEIIIKLLEILN